MILVSYEYFEELNLLKNKLRDLGIISKLEELERRVEVLEKKFEKRINELIAAVNELAVDNLEIENLDRRITYLEEKLGDLLDEE